MAAWPTSNERMTNVETNVLVHRSTKFLVQLFELNDLQQHLDSGFEDEC